MAEMMIKCPATSHADRYRDRGVRMRVLTL